VGKCVAKVASQRNTPVRYHCVEQLLATVRSVGIHPTDSDVLALFPTFVWKFQWAADVTARVNADIRACADATYGRWRMLSAHRSWQSDPDLHQRPEMTEFVAQTRAAAVPVLRFLAVADAAELTGCWINVNGTGSAHAMHTHPNNYLSGVYYVQTAPGANTIYFHDPRPQTSVLRPPVTQLGGQNADQVVVSVEDGVLLLFPAYLPHSVPPNDSEHLRISVGFNLMFPRFVQRMSAPQWSGSETAAG
jgi:uncharacterized protein (TIGR02466 family)